MKRINESVLITARREFGCLSEMFIEGRRSLKDGSHILAYRSKIWVLPDHDYDAASKRIQASIRREAQLRKAKFDPGIQGPLEDRPDVLHAVYSNVDGHGRLEVQHGPNFQQDPELSLLVKKVAQALKVTSITTGNSLHHTDELKPEKMPTWGYHGTSTRYLRQILKHGISPKPENTNFKTVEHEDHIFLTTDPIKAVFHAMQASQEMGKSLGGRGYGEDRVKKNDIGHWLHQPIVLKVKIPDPSLLDADFDIDRDSSQHVYGDIHSQHAHSKPDKGTMPGNSEKISKAVGVFGYKGRILPQNITEVLVGPHIDPEDPPEEADGLNDYASFTPAEVKTALATAKDHDLDMGNVDLKDFIRMPDEFVQQDEENEDGE